MLDIRYFDVAGEERPVAFPFQAFVELMGNLGYQPYLSIYQSPRHQLKILEVGLKYGHRHEGKLFKLQTKQIEGAAGENMKMLADVFKFYDTQLAEFLTLYQVNEEELPKNGQEISEEEVEAQKKLE